jgi:outer membrane receptor protein involved in Fe transport
MVFSNVSITRPAMLALIATHGVLATQVAIAQDSQPALEEVLVTSSRVQAEGFTAPTPTSVITEAEIQSVAAIQVSETLQLIPSFRSVGVSSSAAVYANLRSLGASRNLVLIDGRRHVPTTPEGTLDLNLIPASLVSRTEVVTGGASASWGSDAVAGVINLMLNTDLEGLRASAQYGEAEYGDAETSVFSLAGGMPFAGERGHVVMGVEYAEDRGIADLQAPYLARPWAYEMRGNLANRDFATNGLPGVIYSRDIRRADTSAGGLITNGPLRGRAFNPDGSMYSFGYGQVFGNNMIGGTDNLGETLTPGSDARYPFERYSALMHAKFDFTDNLTGFLEGSYAHSLAEGHTNAIRFQGAVTGATTTCTGTTAPTSLGGILVNIDNPYVPAATRTAMQNAGVSCIQIGRTFRDMGSLAFADGSPQVWRGVAGVRGEFAEHWSWDAYYQYGKSRSQQKRIGNLNMTAFRQAIDAVVNPSTGTIVCRSTLTNPNDGCVPLNVFGDGSVTQAANDYVRGTSSLITDIEQTVAALNLRGEPLDLWAGPLAIATGIEYRKEELDSVADPLSQLNGWQTGNRKSSAGSYDVKELYAEAVVPLAASQLWAEALDLSLAARYTDYSSSGGVTTWKVGTTWDITDEVRLRATRSRDIRAGNLAELFTPVSTATTSGLRNPVTGDSSPALVETRGNRTLDPEEADTITAGIAYMPHWAAGLRLSLDYYEIAIDGAIGTLTAQQIVDRCYLDQLPAFCALIQTDTAGRITRVTTTQLNLDRLETNGLDFEVAYDLPLARLWSGGRGDLQFRVLANYVDEIATTAAANGRVTDPAGQYTTPHWSAFGTIQYGLGRFSSVLDIRWYEGGTIDNTLTLGELSATGVNVNSVGSTTYFNATLSYRFGQQEQIETFVRVNNLLDEWPPFPNNGSMLFDEVGRAYRVGLRFKFD